MNHLIDIDERWKAILSAVGIIIVNAFALVGIDLGDGTQLQDVLMGIAWLASLAWAIWRNHNFTDAASEGERVIRAIKEIKKATGETLSAEMALELTNGVGDDVQQSD